MFFGIEQSPLFYFFTIVAMILVVVLPLTIAVAFAVYFDRKIWAAVQMRRGPNVVGPFGLLQSFADGIKLFLKETIIPSSANTVIFLLAPMITFTLALLAWAVIPFDENMALANINVGILYILAISSLGVYGIIMSGWASNSRYAFLGGLRSAAQMVSYEVSIGFVLVCVLMAAGSLNLTDVVKAQAGSILNWYVWPFLPIFVIFFISALAETNRPPFDLPEAEAELVAGYQVEYSSMAFALFFLGEYANILLMSTVMAVLFFGGWYAPIPALDFIPGPIWLFIKTAIGFWMFAMVKAFVPRYRYDQLMRLGWKVFLPLSLFFVVLYAGIMVYAGLLPTHG
ncbi:NADH-quinone oxidoreductase subunit NuoH [Kordiimonas pumila]|uniref:NADH-quinone oxidoreductase subunit H n=1 Tax=Kordiimonas pumila TaxID=2161677 RepID=A0ABV7D307_9PROT